TRAMMQSDQKFFSVPQTDQSSPMPWVLRVFFALDWLEQTLYFRNRNPHGLNDPDLGRLICVLSDSKSQYADMKEICQLRDNHRTLNYLLEARDAEVHRQGVDLRTVAWYRKGDFLVWGTHVPVFSVSSSLSAN